MFYSKRAITPAKSISELCNYVHKKMQNLLLLRMKTKQLAGDAVTETIISENHLSRFSAVNFRYFRTRSYSTDWQYLGKISEILPFFTTLSDMVRSME
ncbi:hypothetical protein NPIL_678731 [Nephila pilipes]|uniref:Uncharacterized protein n=1 Tax=Nephila pilipes TaxID=299642 RepID=A0A8X6UGI9_NEPPI|nr:hypothetical protein NPIL_678731 [Nephila pilipes]